MDEYIEIHLPKEKKISAVIEGTEYKFIALLSLSDYEIVISELENENIQYKNIVAKIVLKHLCDGDSGVLTASMLPDVLLIRYIKEITADSVKIRSQYEKHSNIDNTYERFLISVKENLNDELDVIKESIANLKFPQISVPKWVFQHSPAIQIPKGYYNIKHLIPDMGIVADCLAGITKAFINTQGIANVIFENFQPIIKMQRSYVAEIAKQAARALSQLPSLSFSEVEIEEMRSTLRCWGEYGWTIPENAKISEFLKKPNDVKEANAIASKYCNKTYMQKIFDETQSFSGVKKSDYYEAIDNYKDKRYKSCACILFSLIDAKLIRMQTDKDQGVLLRRDVGKRAVDKSKDKILNESDIKNRFFTILRFENVYSCLEKLFEKGNNFVVQPEVINRNFLAHGMLTRRVTKRDCNQLFLLYYNWLTLLERC